MSDIDERKILDILQTLIRMRSCEPGWDELDIVRYIESLFAPFGVYKNVIEHGNNRASLVLTLEGGSGHTKAMMGHIDTMMPYNPTNWTYGPFSGQYEQGMIYGVGASNAKSGVAAVIAAALSILEAGDPLNDNLLLCFSADSDGKGIGAKMLVQGGFLANVSEILFCDPTGTDISIAQKGAIWLNVNALGHSRHIMESSQAINALSGVLGFCEKLSMRFRKITKHHVLGPCSVNLTQIETAENSIWMVPGLVHARIDARVTPAVDIERAIAIIEESRKSMETALPGLKISYSLINKRPAVGMALDAPLINRLVMFAEKNGRSSKLIGQEFYTDASTIVPALGIPFAVMGPGGKIFNDREDEHVLLSDVVFAANVYRNYMTGGI